MKTGAMKSPGCAAVFCLASLGVWQPAWSDIYVFTDADGAVSLSNIPPDDRYTVLIAAPPQTAVTTVAEAPPPDSGTAVPRLARKARYDSIVDEVSRTSGIESALLHAVISVESRYNPKAVSPKGAAGLMQLMPGTAKRYGAIDAFDPAQNLGAGARYLRDLWKLFGGDLNLVLAAFNAGEHAVMKYGNRVPPYRETLRYVPQVLDYYRRYRAPSTAALAGR
jgi:soluble lytic murein transglycosylase-like protein